LGFWKERKLDFVRFETKLVNLTIESIIYYLVKNGGNAFIFYHCIYSKINSSEWQKAISPFFPFSLGRNRRQDVLAKKYFAGPRVSRN